jgi:hypothetical protein
VSKEIHLKTYIWLAKQTENKQTNKQTKTNPKDKYSKLKGKEVKVKWSITFVSGTAERKTETETEAIFESKSI